MHKDLALRHIRAPQSCRAAVHILVNLRLASALTELSCASLTLVPSCWLDQLYLAVLVL